MSQPLSLETFLNEFLASPQKGRNVEEDQNLKNLFLEFSSLLFSEGEEDSTDAVSIKDIGSFELDEFVNFYLSDMFPEDAGIVSKGADFVKRMYKFLKKSPHSNKEQLGDWEEFIQEL